MNKRKGYEPNKAGAKRDRSAILLQPRDLLLLADLWAHAVMLRGQIQTLHFQSVQRTNARLLKLTQAGYVSRVSLPLPAHIGSLACCQNAYMLGPQGIPVVSGYLGIDAADIRRQHRNCTSTYILHTIEIVELRLAALGAVGEQAVITLEKFLPERLCQHRYEYRDQLSAGTQDLGWKTEIYKPDAVMMLTGPGGPAGFAIEVDLGHSSSEDILGKLAIHIRYAASGLFVKRYAVEYARTLVITTSATRRNNLKSLLEKADSNRFWFTTFADVRETGILGPIWHAPFEPSPLQLFAIHPSPPLEATTMRNSSGTAMKGEST